MPILTPYIWVLAIVSLVLCSMGFKKFVYFMSVGYGLSVAGLGVALIVLTFVNGGVSTATVPFIIQCVLMLIYGVRLGGFLLVREIKNAAYRKTLKEATGNDKKVPIFVLIPMWIFCGLIYICQSAGPVYRLGNAMLGTQMKGQPVPVTFDVCLIIGIVISAIGILIEALADKQKSAQKAENPNMVATKGLYKMCRCPNYFGEILFWTGMFVSGITVVSGLQWIIAVLGYVEIVYVMYSGAKRLEKRQQKNYGSNPAYWEYTDKTPILLPLIPVYHLIPKTETESKEK